MGRDAEGVVHRVRVLDVDGLPLRRLRGRERGEIGVGLARVDCLKLSGRPDVLLLRLLDVLLRGLRRQRGWGRDRTVCELRRGGRRSRDGCAVVITVGRWRRRIGRLRGSRRAWRSDPVFCLVHGLETSLLFGSSQRTGGSRSSGHRIGGRWSRRWTATTTRTVDNVRRPRWWSWCRTRGAICGRILLLVLPAKQFLLVERRQLLFWRTEGRRTTGGRR